MSHHRHTWTTTANLLLTLPTAEGWADRLVCFVCETCQQEVVSTGWFHCTSPLVYPDQAAAVQWHERGTALGRVAAQEQRHPVAGLWGRARR